MLRPAQPASVEKNMVTIEPCIYIDITINLDISYETDHIIHAVISKICTKQSNIVVEAHIQSSNPHGGVCRNIVPNILKRP